MLCRVDGTRRKGGAIRQRKATRKQRKKAGHELLRYSDPTSSWFLPKELTLEIFSYLSPSNVCNLGRTCKSFYELTQIDSLWKELSKRDFFLPHKEELKRKYNKSHKLWYQRQHYLAHLPIGKAYAPKVSQVIDFTTSSNNNSEAHRTHQSQVDGGSQTQPFEGDIKLVVVGDPSTDKTELLCTFVDGKYPHDYVPTNVEKNKVSIVASGKRYILELWNTAGTEGYNGLRTTNYLQKDVFLLLFSLVDRSTLENVLNTWLPEVKASCPDAPMLLVGTHVEKRTDPLILRELSLKGLTPVSSEEGLELAGKHGLEYYVECSALTGENVNKVFDLAVQSALDRMKPRTRPVRSNSGPLQVVHFFKSWL
jgi:small GTP-binding protein